ncbi:MAG: hypothetical protein OXN23_07335, partial [Gammaproteobacteria bacterium]|nr:hypothetical protein [Gammaproteobacteria bacterium]
ISAMWEDLEYEFNGVTNVDAAMAAFGYPNFGSSYSLLDNAGEVIGATAAMQNPVDDDDIKAQKTYNLLMNLFPGCFAATTPSPDTCPAALRTAGLVNTVTVDDDTPADGYLAPVEDNPGTETDESAPGNGGTSVSTDSAAGMDLMAAITALNIARDVDGDTDGIQAPDLDAAVGDGTAGGSQEERNAHVAYMALVEAATEAAKEAAGSTPAASAAANRAAMTAGQNVKIERDAWMVSGKIKFGGPIDFRFSYMDADDLEVSCASCSGDWDETAADAWNVGVFYTMPGGTELRLTYSEVDNDRNGTYGQGISGTGLGGVGVPDGSGGEIEMFAVGIVHWFD